MQVLTYIYKKNTETIKWVNLINKHVNENSRTKYIKQSLNFNLMSIISVIEMTKAEINNLQ